jgi:hypothetical protein
MPVPCRPQPIGKGGVCAIKVRKIVLIVLLLSCALGFAQWDREYVRRNPPTSWTSVTQMHAVYVEQFIQSSGFGVNRMGQDLRSFYELVLNGQPHVVERVELIGLVKHPEPTAYVISSSLPQKAFFTNYMTRYLKTRALTEFETNALVELRKGRDEVIGTHEGSAAILGAVRARRECLKCHDGEAGSLLGAFSYAMALRDGPATPALTNNVAPTKLSSR